MNDALKAFAFIVVALLTIAGLFGAYNYYQEDTVRCENCYQEIKVSSEVAVTDANGTTRHYCPDCGWQIDWREHNDTNTANYWGR